MLKYFIKEKEISRVEYEKLIIEDAEIYGQTKSVALSVIRENKQSAKEDGQCDWMLFNGNIITIKN